MCSQVWEGSWCMCKASGGRGLWLYVISLSGASVSSSAKWVPLETSSKKRYV